MERALVLGYPDFRRVLRSLPLRRRPVLVHTALRQLGTLRGGAEALLGALLAETSGVMVPTFTYQTMLHPLVGPPLNGMTYGAYRDHDLMAVPFSPALPPHKMMGIFPRVLLAHRQARRTRHPLLSFGGVGVDAILAAQTLTDPLAPIRALAEHEGWVLLIGVDHTSDTAIHYGEKLAGRRQFTRWALTPHGVREIRHFPGCSLGFEQITPWLDDVEQVRPLGGAVLRAIPVIDLLETVVDLVQRHPLALLCDHPDCERCRDVRHSPFPAEIKKQKAPA